MASIIATGWTKTIADWKTIHTFTTDDVFDVVSWTWYVEVLARWWGWAGWRPGWRSYWSSGGAWSYVYWKILVSELSNFLVKIGWWGNHVTWANPTPHWGWSSCYNGSDPAYWGWWAGYSWLFETSETLANAILIAAGWWGWGSSRAWTWNQWWGWDQDWESPYSAWYNGKKGTTSWAGADASCNSINTNGNQWALQWGNSKCNSYWGGGWGWYYGGSGWGYLEPNTMGWGWGWASYVKSWVVTDSDIQPWNLTVPWNAAHTLRWTAGNSGAASQVWSIGKVIIMY